MGNYTGGVKVRRRPVVCSKIPTPQYNSLETLGARWRLDPEKFFSGRKAGRLPAERFHMQCCQDPSSGKPKGSGTV